MLTVPWDIASASIVYALCTLAGLCFCVVLYKIREVKNTGLIRKLSAILVASQILYVLETIFSFKVTKLLKSNPD
jgi:hypothetical protein